MSDLPRIMEQLRSGTFMSDEEKFEALRGGGRPDGYYVDDKRVPSVTTITGRFKDPGGLYRWHYRNGTAGREYGKGEEDALRIGAIVHDMVEAKIHRTKISPPDPTDAVYVPVMSGYNAFTRWFDGNKFQVIATEIPLVSREHMFGGTIDAVVRDSEGQYAIADWKTSKRLYVDYLCQIAAYGLLWNENAPARFQINGGFHLCRFSKEHGDFTHKHFANLDDALEQFLLFRRAYENDKILERRAA